MSGWDDMRLRPYSPSPNSHLLAFDVITQAHVIFLAELYDMFDMRLSYFELLHSKA